jgi:hypothetical protein
MMRIMWWTMLTGGKEAAIATMEGMNLGCLLVYISRNSIIGNCSARRFVFDTPLQEISLTTQVGKYHRTVKMDMPSSELRITILYPCAAKD